jgi:hypothetical protein
LDFLLLQSDAASSPLISIDREALVGEENPDNGRLEEERRLMRDVAALVNV